VGFFLFLFVSGALMFAFRNQFPPKIDFSFSLSRPHWTQWRLQGLKINGLPPELSALLGKSLVTKPGALMTSKECDIIEHRIAGAFPYLRDIKVRRDWFKKRLVVTAAPRRPVAALSFGGAYSYLDADGTIYPTDPAVRPETLLCVTVSSPVASGVPVNFLSFVKEFTVAQKSMPHRAVSIQTNDDLSDARIELDDGSVVDWGAFTYTTQKVLRLAQAFARAGERFTGPFSVNMRFFEEGKILLKPSDASALKNALSERGAL